MKQVRKGKVKDTKREQKVRKWRDKGNGGLPRAHKGQLNPWTVTTEFTLA